VKACYDISRVNLSELLAAGNMLVQVIGGVYGKYKKNYIEVKIQ
jgi:hypothetical protein